MNVCSQLALAELPRLADVPSRAVTEIRHVAVGAQNDAHFLTAEFDRRVRVWSVAERALLAEFDTVLDFGGRRLPATAGGSSSHVSTTVPCTCSTRDQADRRQGPSDTRLYGSARADFGVGDLNGQVALVDSEAWALRWKFRPRVSRQQRATRDARALVTSRGELVVELPLALYVAYDFLPSGRYLVTSEGELRDTRDGAVVRQLPMDAAENRRDIAVVIDDSVEARKLDCTSIRERPAVRRARIRTFMSEKSRPLSGGPGGGSGRTVTLGSGR